MTTTNNKQQTMNQSKEWKRELRALKIEARAAEADLEDLRKHCAEDQGRTRRAYREHKKSLDRWAVGAFREIRRELAREERSTQKLLSKITRRIAILEGRLS